MSLVEDYIEKCDSYLNQTADEKKELIKEIVGAFSDDIKNIKSELDYYAPRVFVGDMKVKYDFDGDLRKLKAKLMRLNEKRYTPIAARPQQVINITQTNENTVSFSASINVAIEQLDKLAHSGELSEDDKDVLFGKLYAIEMDQKRGAKKSELWGKIGNTLKWLGDKSVQVGIAALPYIIAALQNAPQ